MYQLSRLMLTLAAALMAYCLVLAAILAVLLTPPQAQGPAAAIIAAVFVAGAIASRKRRRLLSAFGTAAWASIAELARAGMLGAKTGLLLGRIPVEGAPFVCAIKALLNTRLDAKDACREFFDNLNRRQRKQGRLVRLPQAVHTMVVAPTGVGKGVSCIIPFLLTCEESCVVVDFKGENALLTAERRRRMGHNIVILDPFKVVTQ